MNNKKGASMGNQRKIKILLEEELNKRRQIKKLYPKKAVMAFHFKPSLEQALLNHPKGESLYDTVLKYIARMRNPYFIKKSGKLDEAGFYTYARIDKNTWSNLRWGKTLPKKETLLKLIIALRLNMDEANKLMHKASNSLTDIDPRDRIIMALIDIRCYDIEDVYEILEDYGKNGAQPFKNIY